MDPRPPPGGVGRLGEMVEPHERGVLAPVHEAADGLGADGRQRALGGTDDVAGRDDGPCECVVEDDRGLAGKGVLSAHRGLRGLGAPSP